VIECWRSDSRRGIALTWVERNACWIDVKFKRLKEHYPGIRCIALVEVPQVDDESVRSYAEAVMRHADFLTRSVEEFGDALLGDFGAR